LAFKLQTPVNTQKKASDIHKANVLNSVHFSKNIGIHIPGENSH
jgi:hypothetical protein